MKTKEVVKTLKKEYRAVKPSRKFQKNGWEDLQMLLLAEKQSTFQSFGYRWVTVSVVVFCLLVSGVGGTVVAAKAMPGHILYPLKHIAQRVISTVTSTPLEKTAQETEKSVKGVNADKPGKVQRQKEEDIPQQQQVLPAIPTTKTHPVVPENTGHISVTITPKREELKENIKGIEKKVEEKKEKKNEQSQETTDLILKTVDQVQNSLQL